MCASKGAWGSTPLSSSETRQSHWAYTQKESSSKEDLGSNPKLLTTYGESALGAPFPLPGDANSPRPEHSWCLENSSPPPWVEEEPAGSRGCLESRARPGDRRGVRDLLLPLGFDNRAGHTRKSSSYAEDRKGSIPLFSTSQRADTSLGECQEARFPAPLTRRNRDYLLVVVDSTHRSAKSIVQVRFLARRPGSDNRTGHTRKTLVSYTSRQGFDSLTLLPSLADANPGECRGG